MKWLLTILLGGLISCMVSKQVSEENLTGKYQYIGEYGISSSIEILPDKTFKYQWSAGMNSGTSMGKWQYKKGFIILNSEKQPSSQNTDTYEVLQELSKQEKTVTIKVVDSEKQPVPFVNCLLNTSKGEKKGVTTEKGICSFETAGTIDKITLAYVGFKTAEYTPKETANYFEILLRKENENYEFFTNDKWEVKKDKLIMLNKKGKNQIYHKLKK
jgi:hypothetical protein